MEADDIGGKIRIRLSENARKFRESIFPLLRKEKTFFFLVAKTRRLVTNLYSSQFSTPQLYSSSQFVPCSFEILQFHPLFKVIK